MNASGPAVERTHETGRINGYVSLLLSKERTLVVNRDEEWKLSSGRRTHVSTRSRNMVHIKDKRGLHELFYPTTSSPTVHHPRPPKVDTRHGFQLGNTQESRPRKSHQALTSPSTELSGQPWCFNALGTCVNRKIPRFESSRRRARVSLTASTCDNTKARGRQLPRVFGR